MNRNIITPLTIGSSLIVSITGIMMFFHWRPNFTGLAHEWIGWLMVIAVVFHSIVNIKPFKKYFYHPTAQLVLGVSLVVMVLSVALPSGEDSGGSPVMVVMQTMSQASVADIAGLTHSTSEQLLDKLNQAGFPNAIASQSIEEISGGDMKKTDELLALLLQ